MSVACVMSWILSADTIHIDFVVKWPHNFPLHTNVTWSVKGGGNYEVQSHWKGKDAWQTAFAWHYARLKNTDCSHLSVKGRWKLGRKLKSASNYPVASPSLGSFWYLYEAEMLETYWYHVTKEMKFLGR